MCSTKMIFFRVPSQGGAREDGRDHGQVPRQGEGSPQLPAATHRHRLLRVSGGGHRCQRLDGGAQVRSVQQDLQEEEQPPLPRREGPPDIGAVQEWRSGEVLATAAAGELLRIT